ncbi:MAG: beta-propeller domain-containing protein, partial [Planctomycetes bacterium]|nr:beta-propeller domain-containing protein [Planctomycetota bacterium]
MRAYILMSLGLGAVLLSGCQPILDLLDPPGGDSNDNDTPTETGEAALRAFSSADEMRDYFIDQVRNTNDRTSDDSFAVSGPTPDSAASSDGGGTQGDASAGEDQGFSSDDSNTAGPADGDAGGSVEDASSDPGLFSGTTTQEIDVQEADVVKTDGSYLYVLTGSELKIAAVEPLEVIASLPMDGDGRDVYLLEDRLIILTEPLGEPKTILIDPSPIDVGVSEPGDVVSGSSGSDAGTTDSIDSIDAEPVPPSGQDIPLDENDEIASDDMIEPVEPILVDGDAGSDGAISYFLFYRPQVQVTVVDITDRSAPTVLSRTTFEGRTVSSRMIDRRLHLVIANHPEFFYDVLPLGQLDPVYDDIELDDLLPDYVSVDADGQQVAGSIVGWQRFYRPTDPDGFGVTSVISMDVDDAAGFEAVGVVAQPALIYASREALYLTDMDYTWWGAARETTDIYKFSFTDTGVELTAAGTVPGRIADQYHMSEHNGDLRVASSTFSRFDRTTGAFEESGNNVYVLRNVDGSLEIVGRVENIAPGEDLKAVRFMGDRAIVVTFRQTDPFFTIDLSDPTAPRVA